MADRWVVLDVGETLIDETRIWSAWADALGIPRLTFLAGLGATLARGGDYRDVFALFGAAEWNQHAPDVEARHGGFQPQDLYPDALRALDGLRAAGYRIAIVANQPAMRHAQLEALGVLAEVMGMSDALGVAKPDPAFFERVLDLTGAEPAQVAYVGDRVDNDVVPAIVAGMRAIWIRRGPWGVIQELLPGTDPALVVDSLDELVERIGEVWPRPD
ncbi:MAG: HAD family hydrolase [Chloroflexi bacterium]|nr:HAD family hydrolase [Chloroflexota bacterium]